MYILIKSSHRFTPFNLIFFFVTNQYYFEDLVDMNQLSIDRITQSSLDYPEMVCFTSDLILDQAD